MIIGTAVIEARGVVLTKDMHSFVRAVKVEIVDDSVEISQFPYVCVFCGRPALYSFMDKGVCDYCHEELQELINKVSGGLKKRR